MIEHAERSVRPHDTVRPSTGQPSGPIDASRAGHVLTLQRLVGNAATCRIVQRLSEDSVASAGLGLLAGLAGVPVDLASLGVELLLSDDREKTIAEFLIRAGQRDADELTDALFLLRHPERIGQPLDSSETELIAEWKALRSSKVKPLLRSGKGKKAGIDKPLTEEEREKQIERATDQALSDSDAVDAKMAAALPDDVTVEDWFADHEPDATFLGQRIRASGGTVGGVHRDFREKLDEAAKKLREMPAFAGKSDPEIREELGIRDIGGLRRPRLATKGSMLSMHSWGMAVDINAGTNPFVGNADVKKTDEKKKPLSAERIAELTANRSPRIIERAMLLLHGEQFDVESRLLNDEGTKLDALESWDVHHRASEALAEYLRLADDLDGERLRELVDAARARGDPHDLEWWKSRIRTDRDVIRYWDFGKHDRPQETGYMDIPRELVEAMDAVGLTWGGTYNKEKDMMHFDWRGGSVQRPRHPSRKKKATDDEGDEGAEGAGDS